LSIIILRSYTSCTTPKRVWIILHFLTSVV
jgi:hypothetical protein